MIFKSVQALIFLYLIEFALFFSGVLRLSHVLFFSFNVFNLAKMAEMLLVDIADENGIWINDFTCLYSSSSHALWLVLG